MDISKPCFDDWELLVDIASFILPFDIFAVFRISFDTPDGDVNIILFSKSLFCVVSRFHVGSVDVINCAVLDFSILGVCCSFSMPLSLYSS